MRNDLVDARAENPGTLIFQMLFTVARLVVLLLYGEMIVDRQIQ